MKTWFAALVGAFFSASTAFAAPVSYTVDFEFGRYQPERYSSQVVSGSITYRLDMENRVAGGLPKNNFFNELEILDFSLFGLTGSTTTESAFDETNVSGGYAINTIYPDQVASALIRPTANIGSMNGGDFYLLLGGDLSRGEVLTGYCFGGFVSLTTHLNISGGGITYIEPCTANILVSAYTPPTTGAPAVPLPASLPLLLAGVAGMGALSRRRKG